MRYEDLPLGVKLHCTTLLRVYNRQTVVPAGLHHWNLVNPKVMNSTMQELLVVQKGIGLCVLVRCESMPSNELHDYSF